MEEKKKKKKEIELIGPPEWNSPLFPCPRPNIMRPRPPTRATLHSPHANSRAPHASAAHHALFRWRSGPHYCQLTCAGLGLPRCARPLLVGPLCKKCLLPRWWIRPPASSAGACGCASSLWTPSAVRPTPRERELSGTILDPSVVSSPNFGPLQTTPTSSSPDRGNPSSVGLGSGV